MANRNFVTTSSVDEYEKDVFVVSAELIANAHKRYKDQVTSYHEGDFSIEVSKEQFEFIVKWLKS